MIADLHLQRFFSPLISHLGGSCRPAAPHRSGGRTHTHNSAAQAVQPQAHIPLPSCNHMTGEGQPGPKMPTSVKGLRALIAQAGLEYHHLIEKSELVDRAREAMVLINSSSREQDAEVDEVEGISMTSSLFSLRFPLLSRRVAQKTQVVSIPMLLDRTRRRSMPSTTWQGASAMRAEPRRLATQARGIPSTCQRGCALGPSYRPSARSLSRPPAGPRSGRTGVCSLGGPGRPPTSDV